MRIQALTLTVLLLAACGGAPRVEPVDGPTAEECETEWGGPRTECPQADWVRSAAQDAGYSISGETGSALVAEGRGQSFYIWSTEMDPELSSWKPTGVVDDVSVYGDGRIWRWWIVDDVGLVIWLSAGPRLNSRLPTIDELSPLVRAASRVEPTWQEERSGLEG